MTDERGPNHQAESLPKELNDALEYYHALADQADQAENNTSRDEARRQALARYSEWSEHLREHFRLEDCLLGVTNEIVDSTQLGRPTESSREAPYVGRIGHFELREQLGMGAFGTVWKARDAELDRTVAIKIPRKGTLSPQEAAQFLREARAAAQLKHPNIVSVHEVGREGETVYIVSDLIDGLTLTDWLTGHRPDPRQGAELCVKIADALHHAHEHGVIHRDLKPGNIMLDRALEPHIMDFGLAKRETGEITMTMDGQVMGTPAYMSPEQARGESHRVDRRADVYSMGVILFELLTGERPFRGNHRMLLHQLLTEDAPSPRALNPAIPKDLETVCLKCLEKSPESRYATASGLANDLRRHLNGEPIMARPIGRIERAWRYARRHPSKVGMSAAVMVAMLALVGVGVGRSYQGQLETANTALEDANSQLNTANSNLEDSLDREQDLVAQLTQSLTETEAARSIAVEANEAYDQLLYVQRVNSALNKWYNNEPQQARQLLEECPPERRGWEWYYVHHVCHPEEMLTLTDHAGGIHGMAFSPDGTQIVSAGNEGKLRVWDATTGEEIRSFSTQDSDIRQVAFSADGMRIASGNADGTIKVWDAGTGEELLKLTGHVGPIFCLSFSHDGERIISGGDDETLRIWDSRTGQQKFIHTDEDSLVNFVYAVEFSSDDTRFVSATADGAIRVWDALSGQVLLTLNGPTNYPLYCVAFSPDGERVCSGGPDGIVKVWDASTGNLTHTLPMHAGVVARVQFSRDGKRIISQSVGGSVKLWHAETGQITPLIAGDFDVPSGLAVAFNPDATRFASRTADGTIKVWDAERQLAPYTFTGHTGWVSGVAFAESGTAIVSWSELDDTVRMWDVDSGLQTHAEDIEFISHLKFTSSGALIHDSMVRDELLTLWDARFDQDLLVVSPREPLVVRRKDSVITFSIGENPEGLYCAAVSPDGKQVVVASLGGGEIRVWDLETGLVTRSIWIGPQPGAITFSPDGGRLAVACPAGPLRLWDIESGEEIHTLIEFPDYQEGITVLEFNDDGSRLYGGITNGTIKVWDVESGEELLTLTEHSNRGFNCLDISPDGTRIVSGSGDRTLKIWDATTGIVTLTLTGHTYPITSVAFSPDGSSIVSSSMDTTIKLWEADAPD